MVNVETCAYLYLSPDERIHTRLLDEYKKMTEKKKKHYEFYEQHLPQQQQQIPTTSTTIAVAIPMSGPRLNMMNAIKYITARSCKQEIIHTP